MLYQYEFGSTNESESLLANYVNFTLAVSPVKNETCRYRDYRDANGNRTMFYWKLMFVRFAFVVIFEHLVFTICRLIDLFVPDIPKSVECKIKRESYLAKQALTDSDALLRVNVFDDSNGNVGDVETKWVFECFISDDVYYILTYFNINY